jgi:Spy/CpxP family protein refolding chaperone
MKRLATSLIVLLFIAGSSFAQGTMQQRGQGGMMGWQGQGGMHPMFYSMMVNHVIMSANTLNLTDAQKKELTDVQEKYVYPMVHKEADFKISHMKIMNMLQDPNFDPAKVKAEIKASNDINLDIANMLVDALAAVRKAVGVENFKKIGTMPMMSGRMTKGATPAPK